jgi:hypothetical protein
MTLQRRLSSAFKWADCDVIAALADDAGLVVDETTCAELLIRAASPEVYIAAG